MPHNPRPDLRIIERQAHVAKLYAQGYTQQQLAAKLAVSQATIARDIQAVERLWEADALKHHTARKNKLLEELQLARAEAWIGWQRSLEQRETTVTEETEGGSEAPRRKASVREEQQAGDCPFLSEIRQSILNEAKLRGLLTPSKLLVNFEDLSEAQVLRLSKGEPYEHVLQSSTPPGMAQA